MKKAAYIAQTAVFLVFIFALGLLHVLLPDRTFSEQENTVLQSFPSFSLSALASGKYTERLEDYVNDQFPFRERWITLKAVAELTEGKQENNGVYLCPGETLLQGYSAPSAADLDRRAGYLNALAGSLDIPVYLALVPSSGEILRDKLPTGAPNDSQRAVADYVYALVSENVRSADLCAALAAHSAEPIYYRTDHHWTTLGAWYGYEALGKVMGFDPVPLSAYSPRVVTEDFYGTTWSASGFSWVAPDRITVYVAPGGEEITNYPQGAPVAGQLYDESRLTVKDKYSYFFGGNTPLLTVSTGNPGPKLLILRDSYMDSLSPFLFPHFSELHILDLRYYSASLKAYLEEQEIDQVLICYNIKNFSEDPYLFLAAH